MARRANPLRGVIREELENAQGKLVHFRKVLKDLPRGSLVRKVIKGKVYWYMAERDGAKVRFHYMGKLESGDIAKHGEAKLLRGKYRRIISDLRAQIADYKRIINERKRSAV